MKRKRYFEWMKDMLAVIIFLLLFPYFAISFREQKDELMQREKESSLQKVTDQTITESDNEELSLLYRQLSEPLHNQKYFVIWEEEGVSMRLPVEHFLIGGLAASIPVSYDEEVLKAQAVVLRSTLCQAYSRDSSKEVMLNKETGNFWTDKKMQNVWGKDYEINLKKCLKAVIATQGIYLSYKGEPINGCYHGMSAGETRSGKELSEEGEYDYLRQVKCTDNLSAADYISQQKINKKEVGMLQNMICNDEGYVFSVIKDGHKISGEQLRDEFGLLSSNFTWEENNENYIFITEGRGHGFGLDQYYGNVLAKKGNDYKQIIEYFFMDIVYERME